MDEDNKGKRPLRRAAALSYDPENDSVPILSAFGEGFLAEKILEMAEESGVPIVPDPKLAAMLAKMSVGDDIPPSLYDVVAKVLLFVSEMDSKYGEKLRQATGR